MKSPQDYSGNQLEHLFNQVRRADIVEAVDETICRLNDTIMDRNETIAHLQAENKRLKQQLAALGHNSIWLPDTPAEIQLPEETGDEA